MSCKSVIHSLCYSPLMCHVGQEYTSIEISFQTLVTFPCHNYIIAPSLIIQINFSPFYIIKKSRNTWISFLALDRNSKVGFVIVSSNRVEWNRHSPRSDASKNAYCSSLGYYSLLDLTSKMCHGLHVNNYSLCYSSNYVIISS